MKKLLLITLVPMTLSLHAAFVMKEGQPLTKIERNTENIKPTIDEPAVIKDYSKTLGKKIFEIDFNKHPTGTYTKAMHKQDFFTYQGENLHYRNHDGSWMHGASGAGQTLSIVKDNNEKVLRVLYKKNKIHLGNWKDPKTFTGTQSISALPKKTRPQEDINNPQEVTLMYYVKFENGFDWAIGGKLPGLAGGIAPAGSAIIGSKRLNSGFTARFMWHKLKTPSGIQVPGLIGYIYHPGRYGDNGKKVYGTGSYMSTIQPTKSFNDRSRINLFQFKTNKWYKIRQTIKANTPHKSNGTMKVWINDKLATDYTGMKYIGDGMHGKYSVDRFLFSTFYGGGEPKYAPLRNTYTNFKNISVYVK